MDKDKEWERLLAEAEIRKSNREAKERKKKLDNKIKSEIRNLFLKHKVSFSNAFILHLSTKFSSDSLSNKMEIEKLDNFLTNNTNVSENSLTKFITSSEDINLTQIVKTCLNGETKDSLFYLDKIYEKSNNNIVLIRMLSLIHI